MRQSFRRVSAEVGRAVAGNNIIIGIVSPEFCQSVLCHRNSVTGIPGAISAAAGQVNVDTGECATI